MKLTAYHRPTSLDEARTILKELGPSGLPLAGGTSHVFQKGNDERASVDLAWIGHDAVTASQAGFIVGANTRIADLQYFHAPGWVLDQVALQFVSQPMRNMTTLGGNIARVFPWNDFPVALLALDAELVIAADTETVLPASSYFKGQPARLFQPGDLLKEIRISAVGPGSGFAYHKEKVVNMDFSLLTLAVWLTREQRTIKSIRIAAGAGVPLPTRLEALESALTGQAFSPARLKDALDTHVSTYRWKGGAGFSDAYIAQLARVYLEDGVLEAWKNAEGGAA